MATTRDILCGVCNAMHITKSAKHWCPECEEALCFECQSHHMVTKASRNHAVISVESYKKLPPSISEIVQYCSDHNLKFTNFCQNHNALCCPICISSLHTNCLGGRMVSVAEMIKAFERSSTLENIERYCEDLKCNIDKVSGDRNQNLSKIQEQRERIQTEIQQLRVTINTHLDRLENDIITELLTAENEVKLKIEALLTKLSTEFINVDALQKSILAVKEYASDFQTCLGSKAIVAEVKKAEKFLHSLLEDGSLQHQKLTCNLNDRISQIVSSLTTFGSVSVEKNPSCVEVKTESNKQAQIMAILQQPTLKSINDITLTLHSTTNVPRTGKSERNKIRGCTVCPNMKIVFADFYNGRLVILNDDGTFDKEISRLRKPRDVTSIDEQTVAVTTDSEIQIINIESNRTERTIQTNQECCGITHHKGSLLWCEVSKGIQLLQLTDQSVTSTTVVKQDTLGGWSYLTTSGDKIYQTRFNNMVNCFNKNGNQLWVHVNKDETVMGIPTGVTVDNNYNIYITSSNTNSVFVLSPDGKLGRKLLGKEHGLDQPWALHYDIVKNRLLVCNNGGRVFRYDVSS